MSVREDFYKKFRDEYRYTIHLSLSLEDAAQVRTALSKAGFHEIADDISRGLFCADDFCRTAALKMSIGAGE